MATTILPYIALQPDFASVIADVREGTVNSEDIYLSGYKAGSNSVHGKVSVYQDDPASGPVYEARDGVEFEQLSAHEYAASCPALHIAHAKLRVPRQTVSFNGPSTTTARRISAFDVSPDASLLAAGHLDGEISITSATSISAVPLTRKGIHLSTVLSLRFFPSSRVLLSASSDLSLNIISADPSPNASFPLLSVARSLKGHKSAVTDTHIVGVGKTVYSSSKDGSIRLWDVAQASKAGSTLTSEGFNPIMRISVSQSDPEAEDASSRVIYAALQNGSFNVFDTRASKLVYASPVARSSPPLLSIAHSEQTHSLATGSHNGVVTVYDTRNLSSPGSASETAPSQPLRSFKRSDASIDDLCFVSKRDTPSLLVATGDGFPFSVSASNWTDLKVQEEYAAHADEGVRAIRASARPGQDQVDVWTAGDDGLARRY